MNSPNTGKPMLLVEEPPYPYTYKGGTYSIGGECWECVDTKIRYATPEQYDAMLKAVRKAHKNRPR